VFGTGERLFGLWYWFAVPPMPTVGKKAPRWARALSRVTFSAAIAA